MSFTVNAKDIADSAGYGITTFIRYFIVDGIHPAIG